MKIKFLVTRNQELGLGLSSSKTTIQLPDEQTIKKITPQNSLHGVKQVHQIKSAVQSMVSF